MFMQDTITELRQLALTHSKGRETETVIPRIAISRCDHCETTTGPMPTFCEPMICLILQGAKCILIGDKALHYDQPSYFISTIDVPATGEIYRAGPDRPYLSVTLKFDATVISDVLLSMKDDAPAASTDPGSGFGISAVTPKLLDSWLRLLRLLDAPDDIAVLGPLIEREIIYRLLRGPCGGMLRRQSRRALPCRGPRVPCRDERLGLPSPFQGGDGDESDPVSEAAQAPRRPPPTDRRSG
jgi:hypothetical protein